MKNFLVYVILIGIILFLLYQRMNQKPIVDVVKQIDTLVVEKTARPDTVYLVKNRIKTIVKTDTVIKVDTVYQELQSPVFVSEKKFNKDYLSILVRAYAPCAVDSFYVNGKVNHVAYYNKYYRKQFEHQTAKYRREKLKFLLYGGAAGLITGLIIK